MNALNEKIGKLVNSYLFGYQKKNVEGVCGWKFRIPTGRVNVVEPHQQDWMNLARCLCSRRTHCTFDISMPKNSLLVFILLCAHSSFAQKVFSVDYASQADVKVFVVDYESQADLLVFKVDYESRVGKNNGTWFFTRYASQADKKIFFTEYASQADVLIHFVKYESQAGWRKKEKVALFY